MDPTRQLTAPLRAVSHRLGALLACAALCTSAAQAQTPISLFGNFVGHVDYEATGGSLRASPNTANACALNASSTASLAGIPSGSTIRAAYLYRAGSGSTPDATVSFNGAPVAADRLFTDTYGFNGTSYDFFSGFAEVISFTTEPIVDLRIDKSHAADFLAGGTGTYRLRVANAGPESEANTVLVDDTLPAGLSFAGFGGAGWSCAPSGQTVSCMHAGPLAAGSALPDLTIDVLVAANAPPTVTNTATVSSASFELRYRLRID